jgi:hypothetical protein
MKKKANNSYSPQTRTPTSGIQNDACYTDNVLTTTNAVIRRHADYQHAIRSFFRSIAEEKRTLDGMRKIVSALTASILIETCEFVSEVFQNDGRPI